jgi:wyosine [tRNA(Phe)-imidazoG37] synthetase (radical SAM superfamily)
MAYQTFSDALGNDRTEYLIDYEGNAFASTADLQADFLSIASVHPMRDDAVKEFLKKGNADWSVVRRLIQEKEIIELRYRGSIFYVRKLPSVKP